MRLSALERLPSFALLASGYAGRTLLVSPLRPGSGPLAFLPYEGRVPSTFDGPLHEVALEVDVPAPRLAPAVDDAGYLAAVGSIRAAIARGDVYEANLTVRAHLPDLPGSALFAALSRRGPPPYAAWLRLPDGTEVVSASPELLFEVHGQQVRSEPMKGTAPTGCADALRHSAKDMAELAMITDLVRNDLRPVCEPRSVEVACERRFIELPYAVQAVSDVQGRLRDGVGPLEVLAALHPGGSVTGAPKKAAMQMISDLEPEPRGPYCGALCWTEGDHATCSLLIRTAWRSGPGPWTYGVGGAIVWQSVAQAELDEIHVKLGALS